MCFVGNIQPYSHPCCGWTPAAASRTNLLHHQTDTHDICFKKRRWQKRLAPQGPNFVTNNLQAIKSIHIDEDKCIRTSIDIKCKNAKCYWSQLGDRVPFYIIVVQPYHCSAAAVPCCCPQYNLIIADAWLLLVVWSTKSTGLQLSSHESSSLCLTSFSSVEHVTYNTTFRIRTSIYVVIRWIWYNSWTSRISHIGLQMWRPINTCVLAISTRYEIHLYFVDESKQHKTKSVRNLICSIQEVASAG